MLEKRERVLPETNGNVRKYLLKSLLNKKFYNKFQKYNLGDIYNENYFKTNSRVSRKSRRYC